MNHYQLQVTIELLDIVVQSAENLETVQRDAAEIYGQLVLAKVKVTTMPQNTKKDKQ